jgi:hypothetical protein
MVIANRLRDGLTVFLGPDGAWVTAIAQGQVARTEAQAASLLGAGADAAVRNVVVNPYLIVVVEGAEGRRPRDWREAIRAFGPTVDPGVVA